jgi:23S rRNA (uracil1939-C5)-methyltransferase
VSAPLELVVERLGGSGDGIATAPDGTRLFIDGALPGERVRVRPEVLARDGDRRGQLLELLSLSPDRVAPPCPHFGPCGGCRLQHLALPAYAGFVEGKVRFALASRGLDEVEIRPADLSPPNSRRRIRLAWQRTAKGTLLGLRQARSNRIVDLSTCLIARPELVALLPPLRRLLGRLAAAAGEVALDHGPAGIDLLVIAQRPPARDDRILLAAALSEVPGVCRISWRLAAGRDSEPIVTLAEPFVQNGPLRVALVPGGFRQSTDEGEAAMRRFLNQHLAGAERVVDLFGGTGALGLALDPPPAWLQVVEADPGATAALARALGPGLKGRHIQAVRRDLDKDPLQPSELRQLDAAILDPPRAGARPQCTALAASPVPRIGYVACDPGSFARDARILVDGGYRLEAVQPIGQFLWSDEVELAAFFRREPA